MKKGMVYLVGAGPGDYGLLSIKALECIKKADIIVYDRLADERLLSVADPAAELIYVGKASSRHVLKQTEINQLLVDKALEHKIVVRLKGGDPFVFGRGGEEAIILKENNIKFEIIPGITSAIAVPAYAGIPVTHRGVAASFAVITGHEDPAKAVSSIRWDKLAQAVDTLVFLMGVENLPHITTELIKHGRPADTPAALIQWGTKPEQQVIVTTLRQAVAEAQRHNLTPPAVFVVGEVVKLREELAWFDNKPLFGKKLLITRARAQASVLLEKLAELGASCIEAPAIKIMPPDSYEPLEKAVSVLSEYDFAIFTSVNGVACFFDYLYKAKLDARALASLKLCAIGVKTAEELLKYGIRADLVPAEFRAEGIIEVLSDKITAGTKILIPRAQEARAILPEKLIEMGAIVDIVAVYKTVTGDRKLSEVKQLLLAGEIELITFTSSSTVTNFLKLVGSEVKHCLAEVTIACIGPITAATCVENGLKPTIIAGKYTIDGLTEAIASYYNPPKEGSS